MTLFVTSAQLTRLGFLFVLTIIVPRALCQEIEIDLQYCKAVCSTLISTCKDQLTEDQGDAYDNCITAHPNCVCENRKGTFEKIFAWAGISKVASVAIVSGATVFLVYAAFWVIYKKCQQRYAARRFEVHTIISAAPVTGNTRSSVNVSDMNDHSHKISPSAPVDPAWASTSTSNIPLEYQPPPPYHDCVRNFNNVFSSSLNLKL